VGELSDAFSEAPGEALDRAVPDGLARTNEGELDLVPDPVHEGLVGVD
jgi:hypothetical protein